MNRVRAIDLIRMRAKSEELNYHFIMDCLKEYKYPRDVVTRLLKSGALTRIKKGIYVFGDLYRRRLVSTAILSGMIYGPSYVSREYALSFHGMIPEGVTAMTCVTTQRNKQYETPMGRFDYRHIPEQAYPIGVTYIEECEGINVLMASPEKALADFIYCRKEKITDAEEFKTILIEDYRIEKESIVGLDLTLMQKIADAYKHKTVSLLPTIIKEWK